MGIDEKLAILPVLVAFRARIPVYFRQFNLPLSLMLVVHEIEIIPADYLGKEPAMGTRIPLNQAELTNQGMKDRLEMSTAEIGLAVRTTNCLEEKGIFTVNDLLHCTREDLLSISNFGEKTLDEVYKALERVGFKRPTLPR